MEGMRWVLPEGMQLPLDELRFRVDIFDESILLHHFRQDGIQTRLVSAVDIAKAFTMELRLHSGILPRDALWWSLGPEGQEVALWRPPQVWRVALVLEAFKPPRRFTLPMPGLVFVCSPGREPRIYAARSQPAGPQSPLYHAPLFNVFSEGRTCPGTHKYPERVEEIPESFFASFFSKAGQHEGRSKKHPKDLLALWEELDGKRRYPLRDLVPIGKVEEIIR